MFEIDFKKCLKEELIEVKCDYFDVVVFIYVDVDYIMGSIEFFEL